jgi:hypothetical protein
MRESVSIVYRRIGDSHVFNSIEFNGFQIGGPSLKRAFESVPEALSAHVSALDKLPIKYEFNENWQDFEARLQDNNLPKVLIARSHSSG